MNDPIDIVWPEFARPERCSVHVKNHLDMRASPQSVWQCLIHATAWPEWYQHAADVTLLPASSSVLQQDSQFRWKTMGVKINSTVRDYRPEERLAWDGLAPGVRAYHAWLLLPSARGCLVITEETQRGIVPALMRTFFSKKMHAAHQHWLESLESRARQHHAV